MLCCTFGTKASGFEVSKLYKQLQPSKASCHSGRPWSLRLVARCPTSLCRSDRIIGRSSGFKGNKQDFARSTIDIFEDED